ncbi:MULTISPECIES: hypothetical protein [Gordonia]|uniref:hypothetical protein n=1 Tax=Gordonia TaxID=2053 RepID=UPI0025C5486A|nr:hypothetical protein [Gordonia sp. UBA5067]
MNRTTAVVLSAAGCVVAGVLAAPTASATVQSAVGVAAPSSFSNYTIGCRYEVRVKVDDAATPVKLAEGPAGSTLRSVVATTIPAADTAIFGWTPTTEGRRTLQAVQATDGKQVYGKPITVTVSRGLVVGPFCFSI